LNEDAVKAALKKLVDDNAATLVAGLTVGTIAKVIGQTTQSMFTIAKLPIHVGVGITTADEWYETTMMGANVRRQSQQKKIKKNLYSAEVHFSDEAAQVSGESPGTTTEHFETSQAAFDKVVDRFIKLLEDNPDIPPAVGSYTIEVLDDGSTEARRKRRENRHYREQDASGARRDVYYSIVKIQVETCGEPDP
jgi:hypothetical protein